MATIATTTNSSPFQYPSNTLVDRDNLTGYLWAMVKASTADTYVLYRSTDGGSSWSLWLSTTRANVAELGSIWVTNDHILMWAYRTNESSQDRIYFRRVDLTASSPGWETEVLLGSPNNGGVAGSCHQGIDLVAVGTTTVTYVAVAVGTVLALQGVTCYGVTIPAYASPSYNNSIFVGTGQWLHSGTGRIDPSIDLEHTGDGKTSGTPNLWVAHGRSSLHVVKLAWNGAGWNGPSSDVTVTSISARDYIAARWDGSRFVTAIPSGSTVVLYERDRANSATTTRTSPTHPQGVVRTATLSYNSVTGDPRVYAVGTSTGVLYYVDYVRTSATWTSWATVTASAILGANVDNHGVRRSSYGDAKFSVYTAVSGSPNTLTYTAQSISYTPDTPTWASPTSGTAQDVNAALVLDWVFSDADPADTQSAYAVSRQIGAGSLSYYRASDATWQATEQKNTSGTSAITLASGWASGSDSNYTFKAKVWDSADIASGYSAGLVLIPSVKVNPTISSPAVAAVLTASSVPVTWTVSEQTAYQLTLTPADVLDSFSRSATDSWSSADTGESYTLVGTAANFDIASGVGTIQPGATSSDRIAVVTADSGADRTVEVTAKWASLPASGVLRAGVVARYVDSSNFYIGEISISTAGVVTVQATKNVAGSKTVLATYTHPTAYVGGVNWRIRASVTGTAILVKAWRAADSEPDWQVSTTDSSITTGTLAGVWARNETAVTTHVASYDTFSSVSLPVTYDSGWVSSTATTATPSTVLSNNTAWIVGLRTKNNEGLASEWAQAGVTVVYTPPATPTLAFSPNSTTGWIEVRITNPTPGGGQPALASQDLYRRTVGDTSSGTRIAATLSSGATVRDWTAVSGTNYEYQSAALGANGTSTTSAWTS